MPVFVKHGELDQCIFKSTLSDGLLFILWLMVFGNMPCVIQQYSSINMYIKTKTALQSLLTTTPCHIQIKALIFEDSQISYNGD
jgi:hypothetical protein